MRVVADAALPEEQELMIGERFVQLRGDRRRNRLVEIQILNLNADVVREWNEPH
jgi:hypothetical protein